jgi:hypothetical protein
MPLSAVWRCNFAAKKGVGLIGESHKVRSTNESGSQISEPGMSATTFSGISPEKS